ncbi:MAG TPA: zinc ABC transporter substrate-binding protein [Azospirillaceae bacterium]|nr:zinc ABC transporter substrate-binding protein [Azospirillaceae bacterium]
MNWPSLARSALLALSLAATLPVHAAEPPRVVASIKPVHALVAGVMAGVGTPEVVVSGAASPHFYSLKPSDAARLDKAQVVFWMGEGLETYLAKPLSALAARAQVVELMETSGLKTLPTRVGGTWKQDEDEDESDHDRHERIDAHLWLDIGNAQTLVERIAAVLAERDPANADAYRANAETMVRKLDDLDAELAAALTPVKSRPFVVFHDAYQYFETRYGLTAVGAIAVSPEQRPGAKRVRDLRRRIKELGAVCVFAEPQFQPALIDTVVEGTGARTATLDPEGTRLAPGPDFYAALMRGLAASLTGCLAGP